jgi:glycosyltransferase involved in cell wall biosynthesis
MYPQEGVRSWEGSFVKEQIDEVVKLEPEINFDVVHIKAKFSGGSNLQYIFAPFLILWKFIQKKYTYIHCHHAFCVLVCFFLYKKVIYTVHEGELNNSKTSFLIKLAILLSHKCIYVNFNEYKNSNHPRRYFIPCGIDFDFFTQDKQYKKTQSRKIFFPADPSRKEKNAVLLKSIEAKITELYPNFKVEYGGSILREDMPNAMRNSFMVVSIGKFESDGLVAKESMALNIPVISTDVGNASYYIDSNSGILIKPNSSSLLTSIKSICDNRENYTLGRDRLKLLKVDSISTAKKILSVYS